ncbi:hypothetical protein NUSPORA_02467 [Nucleospora cyclopteri]
MYFYNRLIFSAELMHFANDQNCMFFSNTRITNNLLVVDYHYMDVHTGRVHFNEIDIIYMEKNQKLKFLKNLCSRKNDIEKCIAEKYNNFFSQENIMDCVLHINDFSRNEIDLKLLTSFLFLSKNVDYYTQDEMINCYEYSGIAIEQLPRWFKNKSKFSRKNIIEYSNAINRINIDLKKLFTKITDLSNILTNEWKTCILFFKKTINNKTIDFLYSTFPFRGRIDMFTNEYFFELDYDIPKIKTIEDQMLHPIETKGLDINDLKCFISPKPKYPFDKSSSMVEDKKIDESISYIETLIRAPVSNQELFFSIFITVMIILCVIAIGLFLYKYFNKIKYNKKRIV